MTLESTKLRFVFYLMNKKTLMVFDIFAAILLKPQWTC